MIVIWLVWLKLSCLLMNVVSSSVIVSSMRLMVSSLLSVCGGIWCYSFLLMVLLNVM